MFSHFQFFHWMDYSQKILILVFLGLDEFTRKPTVLTFFFTQQVHPFFETTELGCVLHVVLATRLEWLQKFASMVIQLPLSHSPAMPSCRRRRGRPAGRTAEWFAIAGSMSKGQDSERRHSWRFKGELIMLWPVVSRYV